MAYDKHTWTCDEPITVERLNHIEDGIANAGGGDCGFECEETVTLLTEESVTTTSQGGTIRGGQLSYSQFIDAEVIKVTFNGTEYECPRIRSPQDGSYYGGINPNTGMPDFSVYPFVIVSNALGNILATETAGTYTIKIEAFEKIVTTTPCFDLARGYSCGEPVVLTEETLTAARIIR